MEEIGFAAYLVKPARQSDLFDSLSAVLAGSAVAESPAPRGPSSRATRSARCAGARCASCWPRTTSPTSRSPLGILKKLGLRADAVANGAEAVRSLETLPYDLVLMDVQMPEMDGLEATRRIRDPRSAVLQHRIPIIAMTAHAMPGDRERCLDAGMDDYVTKPVVAAGAGRRAGAMAAAGRRRGARRTCAAATRGSRARGGRGSEGAGLRPGGHAGSPDGRRGPRAHRGRRLPGGRPAADRGAAGATSAPATPRAPLRQAHTIKGASANVGGEALRAVAFEMETARRVGRRPRRLVAGPPARTSSLEFARLKAAMLGFIGREAIR